MKDKLKEKYLSESYRNRLLVNKLDHMLRLVQDCNSCWIKLRFKSQHVNIVPNNDVDDFKVVEDVHIPFEITIVIEDKLVVFGTLIINKIHVSMRVLLMLWIC